MTFQEYIARHLRVPFCWGQNDCVLFAAKWVKQATGIDYLEGVPAWHSERQALRLIRRMGGLQSLIDARLERVHPNLARDGDVALWGGRVCLFAGAHIVGPGPDGLNFINRMEAECAWHY